MSTARIRRFTFTPKQGWSTSDNSPAKTNSSAAHSALPPLSASTCSAALLSISPTLGFDSASNNTRPALISPRAHVNLTRCTSAPPATPSPRKRQRQHSDTEEDERWSYAASEECREAEEADVDAESVDSELFAIAGRQLSILVSPVCIRERPHCPVPHSPAESLTSHSSSSTAPSPRRPLFVNRIVTADQRRASPRLHSADNRPSTAPTSSTASLSSSSLPSFPALSLSTTPSSASTPLSSPYAASIAIVTPSTAASSQSTTVASRTRSQWHRFRMGSDGSRAGAEQSSHALTPSKRAVSRRIIVPTLVHDAQKQALALPTAPSTARSHSASSVQELSPPRRGVSIPASPQVAGAKRRRSEAAIVAGSAARAQSMRRSWSRGEQRSMRDFLVIA